MPTVYQIVTEKFIEALKQDIVPWQKPWVGGEMPSSRNSGKYYRGINVLLLGMSQAIGGFKSSEWLTYKQAESLGGKVRKGEKSSLITFWKQGQYTKETPSGDEETRKGFMLRYYNVFNLDQCDGIEPSKWFKDIVASGPVEPFQIDAQCSALVSAWNGRPTIKHAGHQPCYNMTTDTVAMPQPETFLSAQHYYHTLFHELVHSTGHKSRLDRDMAGSRRTNAYAKEELIAEIGASFMSTLCGIYVPDVVDNATTYVRGWIKVFQDDEKFIMQASSAAQKAVDHIKGVSWEKELAEAA